MNSKVDAVIIDMTDNISNFADALKILEEVSKEYFTIDVWIPSQNKSVKIKEINAKQQKEILEFVLNSRYNFSEIFYKIIKENWLDENIILDRLTTIDEISIAFYLRYNISKTLKINFNEETALVKEIEILPIINSLKDYKHPDNKFFNFTKNDLELELEFYMPLIKDDIDFDNFILNHKKNINDVEQTKDVLLDSFICEFAKYIKEIKINKNPLNYQDLETKQRIELVENLPASFVKEVFDEVYNIKTDFEKLYTIENEGFTKIIEVDGSFFL
jgi:hypothetical protein